MFILVILTTVDTLQSQTIPRCYAKIQEDSIDLAHLLALAQNTHSGGVVLFCGNVRDHSHSRHSHKTEKRHQVTHLEYESYVPLAQKCIHRIVEEATTQWELHFCACIHRIGCLLPGQTAVVVLSMASHRPEAYAANRNVIDRVKAEASIWKKEVYTDGSYIWGTQC